MNGLVIFLVLLPATVVAGECAPIDAKASFVEFEIEQAGAPFTGRFRDVSGEICREDNAILRVRADIDPASVDTGLPELDEVLKEDLFFDIEDHPQIQFASDQVVQKNEQWISNGQLTIKGKTKAVHLSFEVDEDSRSSRATGEMKIQRLDFDIGTGEWENTDWLSNTVYVRFLVREYAR